MTAETLRYACLCILAMGFAINAGQRLYSSVFTVGLLEAFWCLNTILYVLIDGGYIGVNASALPKLSMISDGLFLVLFLIEAQGLNERWYWIVVACAATAFGLDMLFVSIGLDRIVEAAGINVSCEGLGLKPACSADDVNWTLWARAGNASFLLQLAAASWPGWWSPLRRSLSTLHAIARAARSGGPFRIWTLTAT